MSSDTITHYELRDNLKEAILDSVKDVGLAETCDIVHEIIDSHTPIYFTDCFKLCDSCLEISHTDVDLGLLGEDTTPARMCQIAVYEWLSEIAHVYLLDLEHNEED